MFQIHTKLQVESQFDVKEGKGRRGRRRKQLLDSLKKTRKYWKLKAEALRSHSVESSLCKRLWACRETDCVMMMMMMMMMMMF